MKIFLTLLFAIAPFSSIASSASWDGAGCIEKDGSADRACYLDFVDHYRSNLQKQYQALGLVYKHFVYPDLTGMSANEKEQLRDLYENGVVAFLEFSYQVDAEGKTQNVKLVNNTDKNLQFLVPYYKASIEQSEFIKLKKRVNAPNLRYFFFSPKSEEK